MAMAALEQIVAWGIDEVAQRLGSITATVEQMATERGVSTIEARASHMIGMRAAKGLPDGLAARLRAERVYVSVRGDSVRVAPHLDNDTSDVDRLFSVLDAVL